MNRINLICLGVSDVARSRNFYEKALCLVTPNKEENPGIVFFDNQGTKLELYPLQLLAEDIDKENPPKPLNGFGGITLAYNAKQKEEVDAIFEKIESLGGSIAKEPETVFWAVTAVTFKIRTDTIGRSPMPIPGNSTKMICL